MKPDGSFEMKTSLIPPMLLWTLEQLKYGLLKKHTEPEKKIFSPKGAMMDFARRFKR